MGATTKEQKESKVNATPSQQVKSQYGGIVNSKEAYEFGGPVGVFCLIVWSHYILFYFWYCLEKSNGSLIIPTSLEDLSMHLNSFIELVLEKGIPSQTTWVAYFFFCVMQLVLAAFMPGLTMFGLPTAPDGKRLIYLCNGYSCYYFCLLSFFLVHYFGIYPVTHIYDNYGEYLVASTILADTTSIFWYFYGMYTTDPLNGINTYSGSFIYDMFMGTVLYPRIGIVDIKMVAEARWSWLTLLLLTLSCAVKQYEVNGSVSKEMTMMVLAHWLYSNATVKGEHCITCTWDMFHERYGWMLNFWNITGVPFLYCFQSFYLVKNSVSHSIPYATVIYIMLVLGYYIFDSANGQKANMKIKIRRNTFPQVPWAFLQDPKFLKTPKGNLLIDGWYKYARKMQYTGDIMMALSWGLICGSGSSMPYFYVTFFTCMILHRQWRDEIRCKEKYGEYWDVYTKLVPNIFFPSVDFFFMLLGATSSKQNTE